MENNEVGITVVGALMIIAGIITVVLLLRHLKNQAEANS
jgi:hypothetical protein